MTARLMRAAAAAGATASIAIAIVALLLLSSPSTSQGAVIPSTTPTPTWSWTPAYSDDSGSGSGSGDDGMFDMGDDSGSGDMSGDMSGDFSGDMSGDMSGDFSGDMSGDFSGDMSGDDSGMFPSSPGSTSTTTTTITSTTTTTTTTTVTPDTTSASTRISTTDATTTTTTTATTATTVTEVPAPVLASFAVEVNRGVLAFNFTQPVILETVDMAKCILYARPGDGAPSFRFTGGTARPLTRRRAEESSFVVDMTSADRRALRSDPAFSDPSTHRLALEDGFAQGAAGQSTPSVPASQSPPPSDSLNTQLQNHLDARNSSDSDDLSGGAVAGIVIGCMAGVLLIFLAIKLVRRKAYAGRYSPAKSGDTSGRSSQYRLAQADADNIVTFDAYHEDVSAYTLSSQDVSEGSSKQQQQQQQQQRASSPYLFQQQPDGDIVTVPNLPLAGDAFPPRTLLVATRAPPYVSPYGLQFSRGDTLVYLGPGSSQGFIKGCNAVGEVGDVPLSCIAVAVPPPTEEHTEFHHFRERHHRREHHRLDADGEQRAGAFEDPSFRIDVDTARTSPRGSALVTSSEMTAMTTATSSRIPTADGRSPDDNNNRADGDGDDRDDDDEGWITLPMEGATSQTSSEQPQQQQEAAGLEASHSSRLVPAGRVQSPRRKGANPHRRITDVDQEMERRRQSGVQLLMPPAMNQQSGPQEVGEQQQRQQQQQQQQPTTTKVVAVETGVAVVEGGSAHSQAQHQKELAAAAAAVEQLQQQQQQQQQQQRQHLLQPLTLSWPDPNALEVFVKTSADDWLQLHQLSQTTDGHFEATLPIPHQARARVEFIFLVDGEWRHREDLPTAPNGFGGVNNVLFNVSEA